MTGSVSQYKPHDSIRGYAAYALKNMMEVDHRLRVVTADLGFGMMDYLKEYYPERFYNPGAAEMAGLGMCVGMALCGLHPVFYTINNFGSWRVAEMIRNYLDHEKIPVTVLLSGVDDDYQHDGWTHYGGDLKPFLALFKNVLTCIPDSKEDAYNSVQMAVKSGEPNFVILRR